MEKVINPYETLFIVDVQSGEEAAKATVAKFTDIIGKNAEIVEVSDWGKRRLAYPIDDKPEGYYTVVTFKAEPAFPTELERLFNIDETVMRSLVIRLDHEPVAKAVPAPAEEPAEEEAEAEKVEAPAEAPVAEAPVAEAPAAEAEAEAPAAEEPAKAPAKARKPKAAAEAETEAPAEAPAAEEPAKAPAKARKPKAPAKAETAEVEAEAPAAEEAPAKAPAKARKPKAPAKAETAEAKPAIETTETEA